MVRQLFLTCFHDCDCRKRGPRLIQIGYAVLSTESDFKVALKKAIKLLTYDTEIIYFNAKNKKITILILVSQSQKEDGRMREEKRTEEN